MSKSQLERIKELQEKRDFEYKQKKRLYYIKRKLQQQSALFKNKGMDFKNSKNYSEFKTKIEKIAKMQKIQVDKKKEKIIQKLQEYKNQKANYYQQNKQARLEYDAHYRKLNEDYLKEYRKKYYQRKKEFTDKNK